MFSVLARHRKHASLFFNLHSHANTRMRYQCWDKMSWDTHNKQVKLNPNETDVSMHRRQFGKFYGWGTQLWLRPYFKNRWRIHKHVQLSHSSNYHFQPSPVGWETASHAARYWPGLKLFTLWSLGCITENRYTWAWSLQHLGNSK